MATVEIKVLVCDLCGKEDDREATEVCTHTLTVDNHATEFETCGPCWQGILGSVSRVDKVGRTPKRRKTKAKVHPFPGESWRFSSHALVRMGERHLSPADVVVAAEEPEQRRPGKEADLEVRIRDDIKVVVNPDRREILTASRRDERTPSLTVAS